MGKDYTSEELAWRTFLVSMIGIGSFHRHGLHLHPLRTNS